MTCLLPILIATYLGNAPSGGLFLVQGLSRPATPEDPSPKLTMGLAWLSANGEKWLHSVQVPPPSHVYVVTSAPGSHFVAMMTGDLGDERLVALDLLTGRSRIMGPQGGVFAVGVGPGLGRVHAFRRIANGLPPVLEIYDARRGTRLASLSGVHAAFPLSGGTLRLVRYENSGHRPISFHDLLSQSHPSVSLATLDFRVRPSRWEEADGARSSRALREALKLYRRNGYAPYSPKDDTVSLSPSGKLAFVSVSRSTFIAVPEEYPAPPNEGPTFAVEGESSIVDMKGRAHPIPGTPPGLLAVGWHDENHLVCGEYEGKWLFLVDVQKRTFKRWIPSYGGVLSYLPWLEAHPTKRRKLSRSTR